MKKLVCLLLTLMIPFCLSAVAEVSLQDLIDANAVPHESAHIHLEGEMDCEVDLGGTPISVPAVMDFDLAAKGERASGDGTLSVANFPLGEMSLGLRIDGSRISLTMDGNEIESMDLDAPITLLAPITFLPENGQLLPDGAGWRYVLDVESLLEGMRMPMPMELNGTMAYCFDESLAFTGFEVSLDGFKLSQDGLDLSMTGRLSLTYTSFDDVSDAELGTPAAPAAAPSDSSAKAA